MAMAMGGHGGGSSPGRCMSLSCVVNGRVYMYVPWQFWSRWCLVHFPHPPTPARPGGASGCSRPARFRCTAVPGPRGGPDGGAGEGLRPLAMECCLAPSSPLVLRGPAAAPFLGVWGLLTGVGSPLNCVRAAGRGARSRVDVARWRHMPAVRTSRHALAFAGSSDWARVRGGRKQVRAADRGGEHRQGSDASSVA